MSHGPSPTPTMMMERGYALKDGDGSSGEIKKGGLMNPKGHWSSPCGNYGIDGRPFLCTKRPRRSISAPSNLHDSCKAKKINTTRNGHAYVDGLFHKYGGAIFHCMGMLWELCADLTVCNDEEDVVLPTARLHNVNCSMNKWSEWGWSWGKIQAQGLGGPSQPSSFKWYIDDMKL